MAMNMADINVFNTFSFKKWSERLRERKMEEEIQRQRIEQVARLRDKLAREREIREMADMLNEDDVEKLIQYLNEHREKNPVVQTTAQTAATSPFILTMPTVLVPNMPGSVPVATTKVETKKKVEVKQGFEYNRRWADIRGIQNKAHSYKSGERAKVPKFSYNRRYAEVV